jgi:predicted ester cyclase
MSIPVQVETFYGRIWNGGDLAVASTLLTDALVFRGSLGTELQGRNEFLAYVRAVRFALADYHCDMLACVTEGDRAFAPMRFSGRHVEVFRGFPPTGKPVHWCGAALFQFEGPVIANLWGSGTKGHGGVIRHPGPPVTPVCGALGPGTADGGPLPPARRRGVAAEVQGSTGGRKVFCPKAHRT